MEAHRAFEVVHANADVGEAQDRNGICCCRFDGHAASRYSTLELCRVRGIRSIRGLRSTTVGLR